MQSIIENRNLTQISISNIWTQSWKWKNQQNFLASKSSIFDFATKTFKIGYDGAPGKYGYYGWL